MAPSKLSLLALMGLTLAACQKEAGADPMFPPIGGPRPVAMPNVSTPTDLTPSNDGATEALTTAVNEALDATAANTGTGNDATVTNAAADSGAVVQADTPPARQTPPEAAPEQVIIQPGQMPDVVAGVNIITYARETTNAVGERLYRRPSIRRTNTVLQCRKFANADDAQRNFLANGGPQNDPLNLDPDGDGFACRWSPEAYRALKLN